jgi:hypothetical protein
MRILVRLAVADFAKWKPTFDELGSLRKSSGSRGGILTNVVGDPSQVVVFFDWEEGIDNARGFFTGEEYKRRMKAAGLLGPPELTFLNEVSKFEA